MNENKKEGQVAKTIENYTAEIPSDAFLWTSMGAMGLSLTLKLLKKNDMALFVGQWAAPILLMGIYNKIVKAEGSDWSAEIDDHYSNPIDCLAITQLMGFLILSNAVKQVYF